MRTPVLAALLALASAVSAAAAEQACPPAGQSLQALRLLQKREFAVATDESRSKLASGLLACLGSPDPELRDEIAFSAFSNWMRGKTLPVPVLRTLRDELYQMLEREDAQGFRRPFAALTLSEIARTDRIDPWMTPMERDTMLRKASAFLQSVRDYRGFVENEGWRHAIAHGSDWLLQLALNPALDRMQLDAILAAVSTQVMPKSGHAYVFGEPERLARPVLYIASRGLLSETDWNRWFASLTAQIAAAGAAAMDGPRLARTHDLHAFLSDLYVNADLSEDPRIHALKTPVSDALRKLP